MDIQLPDGRILRGVPEGTTKEQIAAKLGMSVEQVGAMGPINDGTPDVAEAPQLGPDPSLMEKLNAMRARRGGEMREIEQEVQRGVYSPLEGLAHKGLEFGAGVTEGLFHTATHLPAQIPIPGTDKDLGDVSMQALQSGVEMAGKLPVGFGGEGTLGEAIPKEWGMIQEQDPALARRMQSVVNLAEAAPLAKPAANVGRAVAGDVVDRGITARSGLAARNVDELNETVGRLKGESQLDYARAEDAGVIFRPDSAAKVYKDMRAAVPEPDSQAAQTLYGPVMKAVDDFRSDLEMGGMTLSTLDKHRQILGNLAKDITNPNKAQVAQKADEAIDILDDYVRNVGRKDLISGNVDAIDALESARTKWNVYRNFETLTDLIERADGDPIKMRRNAKALLRNKKKSLGFTDADKALIKEIGKTGTLGNIIDFLARFGLDNNYVFTKGIGLGAVAVTTGMGPFAALLGAGTTARGLQKLGVAGKTERALKNIESRPIEKRGRAPEPQPDPLALPSPEMVKRGDVAAGRSVELEPGGGVVSVGRSGQATLDDATKASIRSTQEYKRSVSQELYDRNPKIVEEHFKREFKKAKKKDWDKAEGISNAQKQAEVDRAWEEYKRFDVTERVARGRARGQYEAEAKGEPYQPTAMGAALSKATGGR